MTSAAYIETKPGGFFAKKQLNFAAFLDFVEIIYLSCEYRSSRNYSFLCAWGFSPSTAVSSLTKINSYWAYNRALSA